MIDTKLVVLETTNGILNLTLYDKMTPKALLAWQRVRLSGHAANDGKSWASYFEKYNSGTYNNQYMVIDYKLFKPNNGLAPNTLWVIEQIPGAVYSKDTTIELERGYWPSYNVPYFEEVYLASGYQIIDQKAGVRIGSEYALAPRGKIFRRDHHIVNDLESFKHILRYNDF